MVVAGELSVIVKADTSSVEKGSRKTKSALKDMQKSADNSSGSFERIRQTAGAVGAKLGLFAKIGVGALTALGLASPALAGHMAKLKTQLFEVGNTMGGIIEPAVEGVGAALNAFGQVLAGNEDGLRNFTEIVVNGMTSALRGLGKAWEFVKGSVTNIAAKIGFEVDMDGFIGTLIKQLGPEAAAAAIGGMAFGPVGAAVAGGAVAVGRRIDDPSLMAQEGGGLNFGSAVGVGAAGGAALGLMGGPFAPLSVPAGAGIGAATGAGFFAVQEGAKALWSWFSSMKDEDTSSAIAFASSGVA